MKIIFFKENEIKEAIGWKSASADPLKRRSFNRFFYFIIFWRKWKMSVQIILVIFFFYFILR